MSKFTVKITNNRRVGVLKTKTGVIATPVFMPDATRAGVKGLTFEDVKSAGIEALVINTYHLYLRPGSKFFQGVGGAHKLMNWDRPIISDSGGYQVFSLIHKNKGLGKITEDGAEFRSVIDGSWHTITPERSIQVQFDLGSDIIICLDDPRPNSACDEVIQEAVERTTRWALRCKDEFTRQIESRGVKEKDCPLLFSVVQGGMNPELRKQSAEALIKINFDGYGFGAKHVDDDGNFLEEIIRHTATLLPEDKPRFALGVGTPSDIVRCYEAGWDMFDCVIPTREGRHGRLFIWKSGDVTEYEGFYETINIQNEKFKEDFTPVDETCDCLLCTRYTKGYLRHLFSVQDSTAGTLASIHNLRFYAKLIQKLLKHR